MTAICRRSKPRACRPVLDGYRSAAPECYDEMRRPRRGDLAPHWQPLLASLDTARPSES